MTFRRAAINVHRIARPIIAEILKQCLLPERDILDGAAWMPELLLRYSAGRGKGRRGSLEGRGAPGQHGSGLLLQPQRGPR